MKKRILVVLMLLIVLLYSAVGSAYSVLPDSLYLTQAGSSTCTLCSAAMMLRSRAYLSGSNSWSGITESSIRNTAWAGSDGLRWSWTYSFSGNSITVAHEKADTMSLSEVKHVLDLCPEGIVLYCGGKPHAVFLIDYSGNTLYCADPLSGYSGGKIPLANSYLGAVYGDQDDILNHITAYWYVDSYNINKDFEPAENYLTDPLVFNVSYYKAHSEDAIKNMSDAAATNHWITDGHLEGRNGNPAFNPEYYLDHNSDLKKAFGNNNYTRAIQHFVESGAYEWRASSSSFNAEYYKANYKDLQEAYGDNCKAYVEHYIAFAEKENRIANQRMHVKYVDENGNAYSNAPQKLLTKGAAFGTLYAPTKTGYTLTWKDQYGRVITKDSIHDKDVAEIVLKANWTPVQYRLDVNGRLDGQDKGNVSGFGTFDLTIGSTKTRDDDYDAYDLINYGTKYSITDIKSKDTAKYKYVKVCEGSASGTVTAATVIRLEFHSLYDIIYNKNTTDSVSNMPANQKKEWGVALTLSANVPTRTGYTFVSWNTKADGTGTSYKAGAQYTANAGATLYAQWTPVKCLLDVNGRLDGQDKTNLSGFGTFDLTIGTTKTRDDDYDAYDSINYGSAYSITDVKSTDTGKYKYIKVCEGSASGTITAATVIRLEFHSLFDITYNKNTTDSVSNMPASQKKEWNVSLSLSANVPTRTGYTFTGWNTKADGSGTSYSAGAKFIANETTPLYAQWADQTAPVITKGWLSDVSDSLVLFNVKATDNVGVDHVLFEVWCGDYTTDRPDAAFYNAAKVSEDEWSLYVPVDLTNMENWFITAHVYDAAGNLALKSNGGIPLLGDLKKLTLSFDADQGDCEVTETYIVFTSIVLYDVRTYTTVYGSLPVPERTYYTFTGWHLSQTEEMPVTDTTLLENRDDHTLYAHWAEGEYTVSYDANGGSGAPYSQIKMSASDLILSSIIPSRAPYVFMAWTDGETEYQPGDAFTKNQDTVLTAVWQLPCTDYTNGKAAVYEEDGYVFVSCEKACAVIETENGTVFTRILPIAKADENTYKFEVSGAFCVTLLGDVTLDGRNINSLDAVELRNLISANADPHSSLAASTADIDNSGLLDSVDFELLKEAIAGRQLKWAEHNTNQISDLTYGQASMIAFADKVVVECENACAVFLQDGEDCVRVVPNAQGGNKYSFTVGENQRVIVVIKGDVDLNGAVTAEDAACIARGNLDPLQLLLADLNEDGRVNLLDRSIIERSNLSRNYPAYYQIPWLPETPLYAKTLTLPASLTAIESEAFAQIEAVNVIIPASVTTIANDVFGSYVLIICPAESAAEAYAVENGIPFVNAD